MHPLRVVAVLLVPIVVRIRDLDLIIVFVASRWWQGPSPRQRDGHVRLWAVILPSSRWTVLFPLVVAPREPIKSVQARLPPHHGRTATLLDDDVPVKVLPIQGVACGRGVATALKAYLVAFIEAAVTNAVVVIDRWAATKVLTEPGWGGAALEALTFIVLEAIAFTLVAVAVAVALILKPLTVPTVGTASHGVLW